MTQEQLEQARAVYPRGMTRETARFEIARAERNFQAFVRDCGDRHSYPVRTVLEWLGY